MIPLIIIDVIIRYRCFSAFSHRTLHKTGLAVSLLADQRANIYPSGGETEPEVEEDYRTAMHFHCGLKLCV